LSSTFSKEQVKEPSGSSSYRRRTINTAIARAARLTVVATAGAVLMTAGVAACGTVKQLTAAQQASDAVDKLGESKDLSVKLSLDATAEQLVAFGKATGETIEQKDAAGLAGASLAVTVHSDKPLKELKGGAADQRNLDHLALDYLLADRSGAAAVELRTVGKTIYLRADASVLAKLGGEDPAEVRSQLDQAGAELGPLHDALTGSWVSLDADTLTKLDGGTAKAGDAPSAKPSPAASPSVNPDDFKGLPEAVAGVLAGDLTFEAKGKADGADRIQVTAPFRKLAGDLLNAVRPFAKKLPGGEKFPAELPADVLDKNVVADLSVRDGALASATIDLAQLDKKATGDVHLPVRLTFDRGAATVQAPDKSTKLTEQDVQQAIGALFLGGPGAAGDPADGGLPTAAPLTDAQVKALAQKTGRSAATIREMNKLGMGYDDILAMAQQTG
jgi:hypothetical protein